MGNSVELIIPVYHPDKKLEILLQRIGKQTIKPNRILLLQTVVKGEEVSLLHYQEEYGAEVYPVKKENFDHGGTRAYGASLCQGDFIMFMTQDAIPADQRLIENLLKGFEDETVGVCYGRQLAGKNEDIIEKYTRKFNYPDECILKSKKDIEVMGIKAFFCSDVCAMYKKEIYDGLGGFVEKTIFNEDMIMAYYILQAGYKIFYDKDAKVIHSHHYTPMQQFHRNFDLGVSHSQYREIFGQVKSESEGKKLVGRTAQYLIQERHFWKVLDLFLTSGFKYAGYRTGLLYKKLPKFVIMKCTMNRGYWQNNMEV